MVTPRLYRMEEEAIFKPVADLGEETENTVPHHAFDVTYHGDTYVFHDGGYCKISASGEVTDVERPTLELSGLTMPGKEYWPYNTGNFYYLPEGAPNYCVISLENPDADAEPLYDVSSTYWYNDVMGDVAVFMEYNGSQDSRCKIVVGNTVMYELTLDRLDSSPGRNNWTVTGHEKQ